MIVPFVGTTYQMDAVSFDNQRCVNLYPIASESGTSKSVSALRTVSGLSEFATIGGGAIRGGIESSNRAFFVSGDTLYEVFADGTSADRGTLDTATKRVDIEENPTQIMIIDDLCGYIFTKSTNNFAKISNINFPIPSDLTFQDGYFIVTEKETSNFWISSLNDGLTWGALDFTTVESSPDDLVGLLSDSSNLWLFGTKTTEVFQNTGNAVFPFQRRQGAIIETGCAAQGTVKQLDNAVFWMGTDENGDAIIWKSEGYAATRISTQAIEKKIAESTNFKESYAWVYHERGHAFYMLQVKGLKTTLCLDVALGAWHERSYRNPITGAEEQHRGVDHVFFNQKHLIGDRETNQVFQMSLDFYDDNGNPRVWERVSPHYDQEKSLITHAQFEIDVEVGQGTQDGQGENPQVTLYYSDDGGHTWSSGLQRNLGAVGQYKTRVKWNKLGRSRDRVYKIRGSDPVFVQINKAIVNGV